MKLQFEEKEPYYLHNRLYIDDLILWIQKVEEKSVTQFKEEVVSFNHSAFLEKIKHFCE